MANITLTEILGGDNIAGSRITINDNFKKVANAINVLETRLDTSYNPGGALNVGNAIIKRYTNPTSAQIFTCEASGLFQGNLNVSLALAVTNNITVGQNLTVNKNITFDGTAVGGGTFTSQITSIFEKEIRNSQLFTSSVLDPQAIAGAGTSRTMAPGSLNNASVLRLDLSTYTGTAPNNCDTIVLPTGQNGQIVTVFIEDPISAGISLSQFKIAGGAPLATSNDIVFRASSSVLFESADVRKLAVTLFYDQNGWRVINVANPGDGVYEIEY